MNAREMPPADANALLAARGLSTLDDIIAAIVDRDVARWGEGERAASANLRRRNACESIGLALNTLAHYDVDAIDHDLAAAARALRTAEDERVLRRGG